jgi:hypothetical protein
VSENLFQQEARKHLERWAGHPAVIALVNDLSRCFSARAIDKAIAVINRADADLNTWLVTNRSDAPGPKHDAWVEGCLIMGQMRKARVAFWTLPGVI